MATPARVLPTADLLIMLAAISAISATAPIIAAISVPALAIAFWRCLLGAWPPRPWRSGRARQR